MRSVYQLGEMRHLLCPQRTVKKWCDGGRDRNLLRRDSRMRDWLLLSIFFGVLGCISTYLQEPVTWPVAMIVLCTAMAVWEAVEAK